MGKRVCDTSSTDPGPWDLCGKQQDTGYLASECVSLKTPGLSSDVVERGSKSTGIDKWKPFLFTSFRVTTAAEREVYPFKESWVECILFNGILEQ